MDDGSIQQIVAEIAPLIEDRAPGKIFQLSPVALAIDFGWRAHGYLFLSAEPARPRLYLIQRRVRDLEKQSQPLGQFALTLRKETANTRVKSIEKDERDRVVRFSLEGSDELGIPKSLVLIAQLTGRSANLILLDSDGRVMQTLRPTKIAGQQLGEIYQPPQAAKPRSQQPDLRLKIQSGEFVSPSEAADNYFTTLIAGIDSAARIKSAQADLRRKISQQQKLLGRLETDLQSHADGEQHKKIGDLLLANLSTARRHKNLVTLIDYFEDARPLEIEIDESASLQEEAARRFELYARSKRAVTQIKSRIGLVRKEIAKLEDQLSQLASDPSSFAAAPVDKLQAQPKSSKQISPRIPGTRRYLSSDGFEILVGRTSQDNDFLTFKIARPNDLWLHTADYGGSHVVVRNPGKKEIAHRTLIEAAQLAAFFSQARQNGKADVHYTQRKFVSKPKGAKPGLVRLQRFKNITVEPKEAVERILS